MPWELKLLSDPPIVEIRFVGRVSFDDMAEMSRAAYALAQQHGTNLYLSDCSELTGGHDAFDLYELADTVRFSVGGPVKEAVLLSRNVEMRENLKFWETTANNRGLNVRVFADRDSALAWLREMRAT